MIDLALLQIIKQKDAYLKVNRYIPKASMDKKTIAIAQDIGKYFELCPDHEQLDFPSFRSMFFNSFHKGMKEGDIDFYNKLITNMEKDVSDSVKQNIINQLLELDFATKLANLIQDYEAGEEVDLIPAISNMLDRLKAMSIKTTGQEFATFEDSTIQEEDATGYTWPIEVMNNHYRNILGGDQYIIAARPGKGKTTFLTHLNAHIAKQMGDKVIVWFNNESRRQRIMSRQIQSALKATEDECKAKQQAGTLRQEYIAAMGSSEKVRVYDIHGMTNYQLESILENIGIDNVGAIIFDMLDNVKLPQAKETREDQRLEQLYQWARELGVKYNCPTFPTSQISNEGDGLMFPTENALKESKTGKQGACDGIIMIGSSADPLLEKKRGISMPKTKSKRAGMHDMREEVVINADRGFYI